MINKVVRFKGNTGNVPNEAGNLYIDGDKAVIIDQAGQAFVFARYGTDDSGAEYADAWPANPVPNRLYVTGDGARIYYGEDGGYVELAASDGVTAALSAMTTIPPATSEYTLHDSRSSENHGSWQYMHTPSVPPLYTLPGVQDDTKAHRASVSVKFSETALSCAFQDAGGAAIVPMSTPNIMAGTVVEYLCQWEPQTGQWTVMPLVLVEGL